MQVDRRESMQVDSKKNCKITILRALGKIFTIDSGQKGGAGSHLYLSNELTSYYNMPKHEKYINIYFRRESMQVDRSASGGEMFKGNRARSASRRRAGEAGI